MNESAIDRGLFRSTALKKYLSDIKKNQSTSQDDIFVKPDKSQVSGMRIGSYDKLNEKGYAPEETPITNGDIIIGKISPIQPTPGSNKIYKDSSEIYKSQVDGVIDRVWTNIFNHEGYEMRKVRTRSQRIPMIGDKFCLSPDHDVLTSKGWKPITEITMKDKICVLDENDYFDYVRPIDVYSWDYNGDMYELKSQQVDLTVTMDHELYVRKRDKKEFELIKASEIIGENVKHKKTARNKYSSNKEFNVGHINFDGLCSKESKLLLNELKGSKNVSLDEIQRLCLHAGYFANIVNNNIEIFEQIPDNNEIESERIIKYEGKVYCVEVPSHVFMVRKNGKPVWTGNCSRHG